MSFVKVNRQKETRFVQQHRVNTRDEFGTAVIPTRKMPTNHFISNGQKLPMPTDATLDSWFFADPLYPLIPTNGRVPRLSRSSAFEATRIDVVPSAKERSEKGNLRFRRRLMMNGNAIQQCLPESENGTSIPRTL